MFGPGPIKDGEVVRVIEEVRGRATPRGELDLLLFREDPEGALAAQAEKLWGGVVNACGGASYIARVDTRVRDSISHFVASLRQSLVSIAAATGGPEWAMRFGSLWWKTEISDKNTPAVEAWWQLFRASALRARLEEQPYSRCAAIGDAEFVGLARQVANQANVEFIAAPQGGERFRAHRVLLARGASCLCLLIATVLAKWHNLRRGAPWDGGANARPPLLYSWFPRGWTGRLSGTQDMYLGDVVRYLADQTGTEPVFALRLFDRTQFVTPATYLRRLKLLSEASWAPRRYVILESFGRLLEILKSYLNPSDAYRYLRMTRHLDFDSAFLCDGLDVGNLFKRRIWRSVLVNWPHLLVLPQNARRLAQDQQPSVVVVYSFEFVYGRTIIQGTREGSPNTPIIGLQHGPIAPMNLRYSGTADERAATVDGGQAMPDPDIYALDGPLAARILEGRGIPRELIGISGPARFDEVWPEVRRLSGLNVDRDRERTRVLVAPGLHDSRFVFDTALNALKSNPRLELILKPHPKVSSDALRRWTDLQEHDSGETEARITIVREGSIYEWMARADVFVATYSSTGVEALAFGLPVVLLVPNDAPDMSMFHGQDVPLLKASTVAELREHVERLADNPDFSREYASQIARVLPDAFGQTDSEASKRLADLCVEFSSRSAADPQPAEAR